MALIVGCGDSNPPNNGGGGADGGGTMDAGGGGFDAGPPRCTSPGIQCLPPINNNPERMVDPIGRREGQPAGNLTINETVMRTSVQFQLRTFAASSCEVMEGCTLPGQRRLLRFTLETPNRGEGDVYLGPPTMAGRAGPQFEFGQCHRHYHFVGYADYRLYDEMGREAGRGHKQSFCLEDSDAIPGWSGPAPGPTRYGCSNMGISRGYLDRYSRGLDCQYVDITNIPPGRYFLRARINTDHAIEESNYTDNHATVEVNIPEAEGFNPPADPTAACSGNEEGLSRDCGWDVVGTGRCDQGQMVTAGCDPTCSPAIGTRCEGNTIMRICAGDHPCTAATAIGSNDDSGCGTSQCSRVRFMCPTYGRYTIMAAGFRSGSPIGCIPGSINQ